MGSRLFGLLMLTWSLNCAAGSMGLISLYLNTDEPEGLKPVFQSFIILTMILCSIVSKTIIVLIIIYYKKVL